MVTIWPSLKNRKVGIASIMLCAATSCTSSHIHPKISSLTRNDMTTSCCDTQGHQYHTLLRSLRIHECT
jgi:hypothetical protein